MAQGRRPAPPQPWVPAPQRPEGRRPVCIQSLFILCRSLRAVMDTSWFFSPNSSRWAKRGMYRQGSAADARLSRALARGAWPPPRRTKHEAHPSRGSALAGRTRHRPRGGPLPWGLLRLVPCTWDGALGPNGCRRRGCGRPRHPAAPSGSSWATGEAEHTSYVSTCCTCSVKCHLSLSDPSKSPRCHPCTYVPLGG